VVARRISWWLLMIAMGSMRLMVRAASHSFK
jgi:hypothetical protein